MHRRPDGQVRQDLPDARLRRLHSHSQDGAGRPAPEHRPALLQRGGGGLRLCGQLQGQGAQEGPLHQRGRLHRLQSVRRELHLGRDPVGVRPRPRHPPCRLQAVPAGRAGLPGHRPRGHLAVHLQLPGRHQGPRLRVTCQEGRVREGVQPCARRDAPGREPGPGLLRAVRDGVHQGQPGGPAADPAAEALHRGRPLRAGSGRRDRGGSPERQAGGGGRLGAGRPDRRLAARAQGLPRQDLRGCARAWRHAQAGHPRLPAARVGSRAGH